MIVAGANTYCREIMASFMKWECLQGGIRKLVWALNHIWFLQDKRFTFCLIQISFSICFGFFFLTLFK